MYTRLVSLVYVVVLIIKQFNPIRSSSVSIGGFSKTRSFDTSYFQAYREYFSLAASLKSYESGVSEPIEVQRRKSGIPFIFGQRIPITTLEITSPSY